MKKAIVFLLVSFYLTTTAQCIQPTIPTINASPNSICLFQSTTVTLSIVSGSLNNATNWHWYTGSCGGTAVGTGTSINVSPTSSTNYYVRGEGGCTTPASCASISVTVHPPFSSSLNWQDALCFGQANGSATLTAAWGPPFTYTWSPIGLNTQIVNGLSQGSYTGTVKNSYGCQESTSFLIAQPNAIVLSLSPVPAQTICYGTIPSIYVQAAGGTLPYNYIVTNLSNNTTINTTTTSAIPISITSLTSTTQYTASVFDGNGCAFGPLTSVVNVRPPLLALGYLVNACDKDSSLLMPTIISPGNGGPYTYNWFNNASTYSIGVISSLTNSPASYTVSISDGCTIPSATAAFVVNVSPCVGLKENQISDLKISFSPNPANDFLTVEVENTQEVVVAKLFSLIGKEVLIIEITSTKNTIDVSTLSNGLYYLSIFNVDNKKMMTEKILIQH